MIITLALRIFQIVFATVLLGLSAALIKDFGPGHGPSLIDYGAFCGAAAIVFALTGVAAIFVEALQGIVQLALDGLATFFLLAGGIAYAATLKVGSCTNGQYLYDHAKMILPSHDKIYHGSNKQQVSEALSDVEGRCKELQASTAFLWFTFACFAGTIVTGFLGGKGRGSSSIV
ncbi:hypothetical protein B7494_g1226 [Chlorociboria aeruginascens]|nr:hypothetical protein B7494_g1226 [Chlorociboria aeruginascens]